MTTFTAGAQNTLPIWIFGNIRLGQQLPADERRRLRSCSRDDPPGRARPAADARDRHPAARRLRRLAAMADRDTRDLRRRRVARRRVRRDDGGAEPRDRGGDRGRPALRRGGRRRCGRGGEGRPARVARDDARRAVDAAAASWRDVIEENAEELAAIESANVGKPLAYARDEMPDHGRQHALLRGRGAHPRGQERGRVHARATRR